MPKFILGSGSPSRLALIKQAGFEPDIIEAADIDETPLKKEKPLDYVKRVSAEKCYFLHKKYYGEVILTADSIGETRGIILRKAHTDEDVEKYMKLMSGRNVKLITSVCLINSEHKFSQKTINTSIKFKHFNDLDIQEYVKSKEGLKKAGGMMIEGMAESYVIKIVGSYSNIMGLPLYQTRNMLISAGIKTKYSKE